VLYEPPVREGDGGVALPRVFKLYEPGQAVPAAWWREFRSEELNTLVGDALSDNLTVAQARARLRQAAALARVRGAARLPAANVEADVAVTERGEPSAPGGDPGTTSGNLWLAVSYELDLWGRVAANTEAAAGDWAAAAADLLTARLSVAAETTTRYFDLLAVRAQQDLLAEQVEANRKQLQLLEVRYRRGHATGADVLRQRAAVEELLAWGPSLSLREERLLNQISTLAGKAAGTGLKLEGRELPVLPRRPETGLPAGLLAQRPDIRAAGLRLQSADWLVAAARADRLPAVRLSASAGWSSDELADLLDDWVARLAGSLVGPVFDAGRRKAEVDRTCAVADLRLAEYRAAVLRGIREVQDTLAGERHETEQVRALSVQLATTRRLYADVERRYVKGAESYVDVLGVLQSAQRLERRLVDAELALIAYRVGLHRALGGGMERGLE